MWRVERQRPVHDGRLHRLTPLHGDAGCSSASSFWAKWELQSHTRGILLSLAPSCCGCVDQFAARGSRTSPASDAWLRAHQNVGSHDFCRCAQGQRVEEKGKQLGANTSPAPWHNRQSPNRRRHPKHLYRKSIETTNTHTCAESDHRMLPIVKCENRSRTTCYRFHRLHSESNPRVGDCGAAHALCVQPTAPFPHALKSKKTHSLTLLLQNHLDHVNILLQGLWARPPVLSLVPLQANHNPPKKHQSKASEQQHGVQKSLITSTICSWICGIRRTL